MKFIFAIALGLTIATASYAQPALFPKCAKNFQLRIPAGGSGVYFDADCKTAYVLPPSRGTVAIEGIAKTSALNECATLINFSTIFEQKSQQLAELVKRGMPKPSQTGGGVGGGSPLFPGGPSNPNPPSAPVDENVQKYLDDLEKVQDAYVKSMERLKTFHNMPGATAQISYQVKHQALVDGYQQLNPGITFRAIPLRSAKIYVLRRIGSADASTRLQAVLDAGIPGSHAASEDDPSIANDQGVLSGESQSGQLTLSLLGACPYYNSVSKTMPSKISATELASHMVAKVEYEYDLQAQRNYKLKYNLGAFVSRIQSSESKGGLFSSKTINKLIVEEKTSDWFEILVEAEDGRWVYEDQFAQIMKAQVVDRAVRNIAMLVQGAPIAAPGLANPGPNGAETASKELRKCPNVYCQAGAAILDVANAIFGSKSSVAEFVRNHSTWVIEESQERKPLQYRGIVDFAQSAGA